MTDDEYIECVRIATEIKDEIYRDLGEVEEERFLKQFMKLNPAERDARLDILILLSEYHYQMFKALELVVMDYRAREIVIPVNLMFWYVDAKSGRRRAPRPAAGTKNQIRDFAVAKSMHEMASQGMKMTRNKDYPPVSAADAVAEVFKIKYSTVTRIWDDCARPDSALYRIFPPSLRRN